MSTLATMPSAPHDRTAFPMQGMYLAYSIDLEQTVRLHLEEDMDDVVKVMIQGFPCRTFVGHVSELFDAPTSSYIRIGVRPLQQGLTKPDPERGIEPYMCVPVTTDCPHPFRSPATLDKPLPWPNCYHPTVDSVVVIRIPGGPVDYSNATKLDITSQGNILCSEIEDTRSRNEVVPPGAPTQTVMISGLFRPAPSSSRESFSSVSSDCSSTCGPIYDDMFMNDYEEGGCDVASVCSLDEDYGKVLSVEDSTLMQLFPGELLHAPVAENHPGDERYPHDLEATGIDDDDSSAQYFGVTKSEQHSAGEETPDARGCFGDDDANDGEFSDDHAVLLGADATFHDAADFQECAPVLPCDSPNNPTTKDTTMTPVVRFTPDLSTVDYFHGPLQLAEDFTALQRLIAKCKDHVRSRYQQESTSPAVSSYAS